MRIKALSVRAPWAHLISTGRKPIELRKQRLHYRGPLLICSAQKASKAQALVTDEELAAALAAPRGVAMCLVDVVDCRPAKPEDSHDACVAIGDGEWAWVLANPRPVAQQHVSGLLGLFWAEVPDGVAT